MLYEVITFYEVSRFLAHEFAPHTDESKEKILLSQKALQNLSDILEVLTTTIAQTHRITSYNVCYTKLLRPNRLRRMRQNFLKRLMPLISPCCSVCSERTMHWWIRLPPIVITSYSIHYTKLYELGDTGVENGGSAYIYKAKNANRLSTPILMYLLN